MHSPAELVQRTLILDDRQAYGDLVRAHQGHVRAFLFRRTRNRELADDLAQETFLTAYRNLQQLKQSKQFRSWLLTIAHRCFLQTYRSQKSSQAGAGLQPLDEWGEGWPPDDAVDAAESLQSRTQLMSVLRPLRPQEQEAILLCLGHEFSHQEAAEILGIAVGTVKSLVLRAREKIQQQNQEGQA